MNLLTSVHKFNNSKLFFSNNELSKILACYSIGVSKGSWKDYAIIFKKNEACFYMFKHAYAFPDCILTKSKRNKKNYIIYNLEFSNNKSIFNKIDDLLVLLKRRELKII